MLNKKYYPWLLMISYSCMGIFFPAAVTQFSMSVGEIAKELHLSNQTILLADTFRAVCLVAALFLSSVIYKKIGLKATVFLGITFQILPQLLIPIAVNINSVILLFLFKGMQGLNAVAFPLYITTITSWIDPKFKGIAISVFNGSFTAGAGIGAYLSGKIIPIIGWKLSFVVLGVLTIIFAVPALLLTHDRNKLTNLSAETTDVANYKDIVRNSITWVLVTILLACTWVSQAITVDMPIYSESLGYAYEQTGILMLSIAIVTVVFSICGGAVSDYFALKANDRLKSRAQVLSVGYFVSIGASIIMPITADKGFLGILLPATLIMVGVAWVQGVFWALPSELFHEQELITATSICSGVSNIVNPIAPVVVGVILGASGFWTISWLTCTVASALSVIAALTLTKVKKTKVM